MTRANGSEAGLESAPTLPLADKNVEGNACRSALLEHCNGAQLASPSYELRTSRCELLVAPAAIVACLTLVCVCGLLLTESDHDDVVAKTFAGFIFFAFFLLGLLWFKGLAESSRPLTHAARRRLLRKRFMAWDDVKIIMTQLDQNAKTRMIFSILNHGEDGWLHFEHLAKKLRVALLLIAARKRDIVHFKQPQQGPQHFILCASQ